MSGPWIVRDEGCRPLTINKVATLHRRTWANHTSEIRGRWHYLALEAGLPHFERVRITVRPMHANRTSPQDAAACAPEAKAAIDGLVDAGVLDDDDATRVTQVLFLGPLVCGVNGMEITIEEVPAA